jgi:23S rRNA (guanosine2251-2'-O)-methyltransferase
MVGGRRRGGSKLLATHQRSWLWGRHLVLETLQAARWPIVELYLAEDIDAGSLQQVERLTAGKLALRRATRKRLTELCHASEHQGFLAQVGPYPYIELQALLQRAGPAPLILVLDGVQDPFNLGAMLRSAEVFGADGVIVAESGQAGVNSLAARASAGAVNRLDVCRVEALAPAIAALRARKIRVIGTHIEGESGLERCDLAKPVALVIGNEGAGLAAPTIALCDQLAKIPQAGGLNSLNAAAAAAVCLYEAQRQRGFKNKPR